MRASRSVFAAFLLVASAAAAGEAPGITATDYARAEKLLDSNLKDAVLNAQIDPQWIVPDGRLWYRRSGADGIEYRLVDVERRTRVPLYERERLGGALAQVIGASAAATPQVVGVETVDAALQIDLRLDDESEVRCRLDRYECARRAHWPTNPGALPSPDRSSGLFAREHNLWLRNRDGERALTRDGEPYYAYGKLPDNSQAVFLRPAGTPMPPIGLEWAPDGRHLFGTRLDERKVASYPYLESVPRDGRFRPKLHELRIPLLGDPEQPRQEIFAIDLAGGEKRIVDIGAGWTLDEAKLGWSRDGRKIYRLAHTDGWRAMALLEIDVGKGTSRRVVEETAANTSLLPHAMLFSQPNVRVLLDSDEVVWFSERDGWGHLYLYDLHSGRLKRALTKGDWLVRDLIEVDARKRRLFFTAGGREAGRDPYYRHLYRVSLDGGEPLLLTPENAEHDIPSPLPSVLPPSPGKRAFSPDLRYFADTYSSVATPPVSVLRSSEDGRVVMPLESADVAAVRASGWRPPQRVHAKAADGKTDVYAVVYFPSAFDRQGKYPVIDATYGGPWTLNAPRSYAEAVSTFNPVSRASLAELGFVVVTIDARGTRGRSRAFSDVGYGNFVDPGLADHIAVVRQLAERYGGLDLQRVGIYGHSFGGYVSARAILSHPDFFKVAVSSAGPHNYQGFYAMEHLLGLPDYGNGSHVRPTPQSVPVNYRALDNATLASNLRGRLMLAYGDLDESAMPAVTLQLADALIEANKSFDLLYLPNRTHSFFRTDRYYTRRLWDYFVEHLLGAQPPQNFDLSPPSQPRD